MADFFSELKRLLREERTQAVDVVFQPRRDIPMTMMMKLLTDHADAIAELVEAVDIDLARPNASTGLRAARQRLENDNVG
jgi:hypothetical protein